MVMEGWYLILQIGCSGAKCRRLPVDQLGFCLCGHLLCCLFFCSSYSSYDSWTGVYRLGHREQKDEWAPRRVDVFQRQNILPSDAVVSAGSVNSACTAGTPITVLPGIFYSLVLVCLKMKPFVLFLKCLYLFIHDTW